MSQETFSAVDEAESKDTLSIAQIKSLVGLPSTDSQNEESVPADSSVAVADSSNALIDTEDFEETEGPTQKKLWQQPLPKLIAVAVPVGIISLVLGVLLANFTKVRLAEDEPEDANTAEEVVATADPEALKDEEIARLKTSNALGNQATVLDSQESRRTELTPTYREKFTTSRPETETREPQAMPRQSATTVAPTVAPTSVRSRPTSVPRPVPSVPAMRAPTTVRSTASYTPPPRAAAPAASASFARTSAPTSRTASSPQAINASEVDPFEQWQKLVSIGSYGEMENVSEEQSVPDGGREAVLANDETSAAGQTTTIPIMVNDSTSSPAVLASDRATSKALEVDKTEGYPTAEFAQVATYEEGAEFIMRAPVEYEAEEQRRMEIVPGTRARGEVIAPVAWAGDVDSTVGAVELSEDLVSGGAVIMPAGTQLIVSIRTMSASGMMDLQVNSIVLPSSGYEQMQIPSGAISIQGGDGQVLMAKDMSGQEGQLRQLDRNQALLGALGQIGSILNRPNSQSTSTGAGGSYSTADYGSPSILGAILEGGANTMIASQQARNQDRADRLEELPSVWVLESGTYIEIFINQPIAWEG